MPAFTPGTWNDDAVVRNNELPAKITDDNEAEITDPEQATIGRYRVIAWFCFCRGIEVATVMPPRNTTFASLTLKETAVLVSTSMELELPPGRLTITYDTASSRPFVTATVPLYSGEVNPRFDLTPGEVRTLRAKLVDLPPTDRRPVYRLGDGFILDSNLPDLPSSISVLEGLVSIQIGTEPPTWFEDANRLESWLLTIAPPNITPARRSPAPG